MLSGMPDHLVCLLYIPCQRHSDNGDIRLPGSLDHGHAVSLLYVVEDLRERPVWEDKEQTVCLIVV